MSTLTVTTINTANGTTDLTIQTGNNSAGKLVIPANGIALTIPVGNTGQRPSPANGMLRFNTDSNKFEGYNSVAWSPVVGAVGGGNDDAFYENTTTITTNYTITTGKNAFTAGPITINSGITVTVPSGSVWTVS